MNSNPPQTKSEKAGLNFPVTKIEKRMKKIIPGRSEEGASIYLSAVLEYMIAEVLELSGNDAIKESKDSIELHNVFNGIADDIELFKTLKYQYGDENHLCKNSEIRETEINSHKDFVSFRPTYDARGISDQDIEKMIYSDNYEPRHFTQKIWKERARKIMKRRNKENRKYAKLRYNKTYQKDNNSEIEESVYEFSSEEEREEEEGVEEESGDDIEDSKEESEDFNERGDEIEKEIIDEDEEDLCRFFVRKFSFEEEEPNFREVRIEPKLRVKGNVSKAQNRENENLENIYVDEDDMKVDILGVYGIE